MLVNSNNQIICVTGASSGIGQALVVNLVKNNYRVIALARRKDKLEELQAELGENLLYYPIDVGNKNEVEFLYQELVKQNLLPNTIVCGAGIYKEDLQPTYNQEVVEETFKINLWGTLNMVEIFLPQMLIERKGHFISLSSIAAWKPSLRGFSYSASKAAIGMSFRALDLAYKKQGVRFSTVYLGPVATTMWEGKTSWLIPSANTIAQKLLKVINTPKTVVYLPKISTSLSRLSLLIPDNWYARLSRLLFK